MPSECPACGGVVDDLRVCTACGHHLRLAARQRIEQIVDRGSFRETDHYLWSADPLDFTDGVSYEKRILEAQAITDLLDAAVTGRARILNVPVVLIVFDFRFLGGSMGSVVGEKVARAFASARREHVPAVAICSSGGARLQEGMVALFQMAKTAAATAQLRERSVPLVTVLADPTMGGVLASFASLGDIVLAEPKARVSFVGPRVHERATHDPTPPGTAEFAFLHGGIDAIVERAQLRTALGSLVSMLGSGAARSGGAEIQRPLNHPRRVRPVWETVELARHPDRPSGRALAAGIFSDVFELHGDRQGGDDGAIVAGLARLGERPVVFVAQDRNGGDGGHTRPAGYRKAMRAFALAERFRLPVITFVDTPGAAADTEAEAQGVTSSIAECLAQMARLRTPIISTVVGEGGSGGALALSVGDRILMLENAIFSVIAPEAASAILYHDEAHAQELAGRLKLTAWDLIDLHLVDRIVPEQNPAHEAADAMIAVLHRALLEEVAQLAGTPTKTLLKRREGRFRHVSQARGRFRLLVRRPRGRGQLAAASDEVPEGQAADGHVVRV
ncbi:MAG TPA: acetyl-CoA carboxylase carboxyltransferase subunit alpha/beta [Candidatus Micrarchaeaceae archaeon]|nr:acetyl-CoA carboxylase carboxyltransferase subunit alpha/beta [Candidatus Micrarchaeaceae archaeon]